MEALLCLLLNLFAICILNKIPCAKALSTFVALLCGPDFSALWQWHSYAISLNDRRCANDSLRLIQHLTPAGLMCWQALWGPGVQRSCCRHPRGLWAVRVIHDLYASRKDGGVSADPQLLGEGGSLCSWVGNMDWYGSCPKFFSIQVCSPNTAH